VESCLARAAYSTAQASMLPVQQFDMRALTVQKDKHLTTGHLALEL